MLRFNCLVYCLAILAMVHRFHKHLHFWKNRLIFCISLLQAPSQQVDYCNNLASCYGKFALRLVLLNYNFGSCVTQEPTTNMGKRSSIRSSHQLNNLFRMCMGIAQQPFNYFGCIFFSFFFFLICERELECNERKVRNSVLMP